MKHIVLLLLLIYPQIKINQGFCLDNIKDNIKGNIKDNFEDNFKYIFISKENFKDSIIDSKKDNMVKKKW